MRFGEMSTPEEPDDVGIESGGDVEVGNVSPQDVYVNIQVAGDVSKAVGRDVNVGIESGGDVDVSKAAGRDVNVRIESGGDVDVSRAAGRDVNVNVEASQDVNIGGEAGRDINIGIESGGDIHVSGNDYVINLYGSSSTGRSEFLNLYAQGLAASADRILRITEREADLERAARKAEGRLQIAKLIGNLIILLATTSALVGMTIYLSLNSGSSIRSWLAPLLAFMAGTGATFGASTVASELRHRLFRGASRKRSSEDPGTRAEYRHE